MIEFNGMYYSRQGSEPMDVLVQFDGVLLHIWHRGDPICRLLSSDAFHIPSIGRKLGKRIRLPGGAFCQTEDRQAIAKLAQKVEQQDDRVLVSRKVMEKWPIALAGGALLAVMAAYMIG